MPEPRPLPSADELRARLRYDPLTGKIYSRATGREVFTYTNLDGYRTGRVAGRMVYAHRVAWKLHTGEEPPEMLDHRNRRRSDNRWRNLRPADPQKNAANQSAHVDSSSRHVGVSFDRRRDLWAAEIMRSGKRLRLGRYPTEAEAARAYKDALVQLKGASV